VKKRFHSATDQEIRLGKTTDVYFERTKRILKAKKASRRVKAEFSLKGLPHGYTWGIFAGLEEALILLEGVPVTVKALDEGTVVRANEPVMTIEGDYADFAVFETPLLGFICQASGVATKAARLRLAARDKPLISFGARRMHPAISSMIERNAYIGGCDGVATLKAADLLGIEPSGTIPHALVIVMGGIDEAIQAFDSVVDRKVNRIALVDTFGDEKFEALAACEALGERLYAVRLDTPRSRRGSMRDIVREVRWELDLRGHTGVRIMVSGGLDESELVELRDLVDGFGVGTSLSNAPVLDFAMDIVEVDGKPIAKRGKMSGEKVLLRCNRCHRDLVVPSKGRLTRKCQCGGMFRNLTRAFLKQGKVVRKLEPPKSVRRRVLKSLEYLGL